MPKQSGLGMNFYVDGFDLSGDVGSIKKIACPQKTLPQTGVNKFAPERKGGQRDGLIQFNSWYNPGAGAEHAALSPLPTADVQVTVTTGTAVGSAAASQISKQVDYNGVRTDVGAFSLDIQAMATNWAMEWGELLTPGMRTDVAPVFAGAYDYLAASSFGWRSYLHITAFTGTNVTVQLQDSADNSAFANLAGGAFAVATGVGPQRIAGAPGSTVRRYVRANTTGTFTSVTLSVMFVKSNIADVVF